MLQGRPDENDSKQGKEIVPLDFSSTGLVLRCNNNQFQLGVINIIGLHAKTPFFFSSKKKIVGLEFANCRFFVCFCLMKLQ